MRRRWIQQKDGSLLEVDPNYVNPGNTDYVLWNDRQYQDANDPRFASRTQHREYMRSRGLTTADDFKGTWSSAERQRAEFYARAPDRSRREDVARAVENPKQGLSRKNIIPEG